MFNKKNRVKVVFLLSFLLFIFSFFLNFKQVLATSANNPDSAFGMDKVDEVIVLEKTDPRTIAVRVINIFLGFLGIIAVSLVIYGGFIWMTSGGNEEKITKAKSILKNALIGLVIILSAWGIVYFIFKKVVGDGTQGQSGGSNTTHFQNGLGAVGNCTVESVYPTPGQKKVPRNTTIMVTFKSEISSSTVASSTIICLEDDFIFESNTCSKPVAFDDPWISDDNKILVLTPKDYLGNDVSDSSYVVYLSNELSRKNEDKSIFDTCSPQYLLWNFTVSTELDLTPPKIVNIFPQSDNERDGIESISGLQTATGALRVINIPNYYQEAEVLSIANGAGTTKTATASVDPNYNGQYTNFVIAIKSDSKAQLSSGSNNLGAFDIINNKVSFPNYFNFEIEEGFESGNSWEVSLEKMVPADKIKVGSFEYTFIEGESSGYNIQVALSTIEQADNIKNALNDNPNIEVDLVSSSDDRVVLKARVGGFLGNSIALQSYTNNIKVEPFSGGSDKVEKVLINDKRDKPMNSIIQIVFDEVVSPITIVGDSNEVKDYIRVINLSEGNSLIEGKFTLSSDYKTVEFISSYQCGANSCGEDIYCLPANSNIKVEIMAANLFDCNSNNSNCANKKPFISCIDNICQNDDGKKYPLAKIPADGIVDASFNSLDGNSDGYADGPVSYFHKNNASPSDGDSYSWSFWINDKIDATPPKIFKINPIIADPKATTTLLSPVEMTFDKLLSTNSLRTGRSLSKIGGQEIYHNRVNLISGQAVGYWISSEGLDISPIDGENDRTKVFIEHAKFFEGASYRAQAGSGVRDIYQNCFKPSASIDCSASASSPSCCDGTPTSASICN